MNIDSHQHFWRYDAARDTWITDAMQAIKRDFLPAELAAEMKASGMDASVAVQTMQSEDDTGFLLDLAEKDQRIAGVVGWVDLRSPKLEERLRYFSKFPKLRGFRHVAQAEPDRFLVRAELTAGIARLKEFGYTYDILIFPRQLPAAIELVSMFPEQRFVLDHMAKPDMRTRTSKRWSMMICKLASNANAYCKLSGLVTEADWYRWSTSDFTPFLDTVFGAFGPDRLMFGSDGPVCLLASPYAKVKQVIEEYVDRHAAEHKDKIFGGNAIRFYGLEALASESAA